MGISRHNKLDINNERDIALATSQCRRLVSELGFSEHQQVRYTTAVSELVRNVVKYADHGVCDFHSHTDQSGARIETVVEDTGPGIPDIDKAMEAGFSTSGTLGIGLSGVQNLVDTFLITSTPKGTRVEITMNGSQE